jgi:hypothetical protein
MVHEDTISWSEFVKDTVMTSLAFWVIPSENHIELIPQVTSLKIVSRFAVSVDSPEIHSLCPLLILPNSKENHVGSGQSHMQFI